MQSAANIFLEPSEINLSWEHTFRVIPSRFPPVNFFEELVDPALMEELFHVESLTNDRLREEVGDIFLVSPEDRVSGRGSSVVMAAFTHISINRQSRFSNGTFGVYYAARTLETAIREKAHHTEIFLAATNQDPAPVTMRVYQSGKILRPLIDVREASFSHLHDPSNYVVSQAFGEAQKRRNAWGIVYNSVRHLGGECIGIFRPPAIPLPVNQTQHYHFQWNGTKITSAIQIGGTVFTF